MENDVTNSCNVFQGSDLLELLKIPAEIISLEFSKKPV